MSGVVLPFVVDADAFNLSDSKVARSPETCALQINPDASLESLGAAAERRVRSLAALLGAYSISVEDPTMAECAMTLESMASEAVQLMDAMNTMMRQALRVRELAKGGAV